MKHRHAATAGRPREFDRDQALEIAMRLFCKHGYEGVSIADLTSAMHISPPSLYAAFGGKEALFREALALYQRQAGIVADPPCGGLREQVENLLHEAVRLAKDPKYPATCLVNAGMLACSAAHEWLADAVAALRAAQHARISQRLEAAVAEGDLPANADIAALARYLMALIQGIAVQAHDGATEAELFALVEIALRNWPAAPRAR